MSEGKFGEDWTHVTKSAIAEAILNLTRLDSEHRQVGGSLLLLSHLKKVFLIENIDMLGLCFSPRKVAAVAPYGWL